MWTPRWQTPRPSVKLLNKSVHAEGESSVVQLASQDELPEHAKMTFFVQAESPALFSREQKIEVGAADGSFSTMLRWTMRDRVAG